MFSSHQNAARGCCSRCNAWPLSRKTPFMGTPILHICEQHITRTLLLKRRKRRIELHTAVLGHHHSTPSQAPHLKIKSPAPALLPIYRACFQHCAIEPFPRPTCMKCAKILPHNHSKVLCCRAESRNVWNGAVSSPPPSRVSHTTRAPTPPFM